MSSMNLSSKKEAGKATIIAILLMSSLTVMVGNAITPAVPEIGEVYGLGNYASWLVTAPALGVVVSAIFFGKVIDKYGPYKISIAGLFAYGILGILGAHMPNIYLLFLDRFLLGMATAIIMSASVTLIAAFYEGEKQLKVIALQGMAMELGGVVFLAVSGFLSEISWKMPFLIYGLGIVSCVFNLFAVPRVGKLADVKEENGENAGKGVPLPVVFLTAFLGMLMFFTAMVSLPLYLQNQLGYSPSFTGNYLAALDLVSVLAAGCMPKIVKKYQEKGCIMTAFIFYACAYLLYSSFDSLPILIIAMILVGIGVGLSTPLFNSIVVSKSTADKKGTNISFCTMAMFLGQFLSALLVSVLIGQKVYMAAAVIAAVVAVCVLPVTKHYNKKTK